MKNSNGINLFSEIDPSTPYNRSGQEKDEKPRKTDIISVSEYLDRLNHNLKTQKAKIIGEVSGLQEYPGRNYLFFSIKDKDDQSTVNCIMWKQEYQMSGVILADGLEIIITATPEIYKPSGRFTLKVDMIELVGEGALQIAYEKLKAKLLAEGLFDESRKRLIPEFPHVIGVITSKSGAVINDFLSNIGKYGFEILFCDSKVEGADAVKDLLSAVKTLAKKKVDVLVIMRGGGSLESFQAFNNETLVRAVAKFPTPVLTGIGHDKDVSLVSLVSDKNVSTPTAVANLLNEGFRNANLKLKISEQIMMSLFENILRDKLFFLEEGQRIMEGKIRDIFERCQKYFEAIRRAVDKIQSAISEKRLQIENIAKLLEARNPKRQLRLGWSIARSKSGKIIRSVDDIKKAENFDVTVSDGTIDATKI